MRGPRPSRSLELQAMRAGSLSSQDVFVWVCAAGPWLPACCASCRPQERLRKANQCGELGPL